MKERRLSDYTNLFQLAARQAVLLQGLDLRRLRNALGLLWEYLTRRVVLRHVPAVVRMDPTSHCNLRCPTCHPHGNTFGGRMDFAVFERLMSRIPFDRMLKGTLYLFGEPFFNRRLPEMIRSVHERGVPTSISTNFNIFSEQWANDLVDAHLSWLIVCVDGADQETYERYRVGGRLDRVLANIETMVAVKKARGVNWPIIEVQCIEFAHNRHQIEEIRATCTALGVERFTVKRDVLSQMDIDLDAVAPAGAGEAAGREAPGEGSPASAPVLAPSTASATPGGASGKRRGARTCMYLYGTLHVDYDGSVLPCCVGRAVFGNLAETPLEEIWNNEKFVAARAFFASDCRERTPDVDIPCYTCPLFFPEQGDAHERALKIQYETSQAVSAPAS